MEQLNSYCKGCDQLSAPHRRREDGQWVCEDCGHLVKCSDPQWSDNCDGDLTTAHEVKKGLCEGCMAVIDSWSDDSEEASGSEQAKLMTDGGTAEDDVFTLEDRIREEIVVDVPDDADLLGAIGGAVEIVRGSWKLKLTEKIEERDQQEKAFTYLLAAYAANIASDGKRAPSVTREELIDVFGADIAEDVAWHGWVRTYDGYAEIRPECLTHATKELKRRYGKPECNQDD